MELLTASSAAGARPAREPERARDRRGETHAETRATTHAGPLRRGARDPGMGFQHELLLALIMALAMAATLLLYR